MRVQRLACLVVCAGALAGCSLGPEYFTPDAALPVKFVTAPTGERLPSGGASPELWQWWRTLHDHQLNELIELAIQNNLDLKIALDRLQQARLQLVVLGAQQLPQVNGGVGGGTGTGTDETRGRGARPPCATAKTTPASRRSAALAVSMRNGKSTSSARSRAVSRRRSIR